MKRIVMITLSLILTLSTYATDIFLKGGDILSGDIIKENESEIVLKTDYGDLTIFKSNLIVAEQIIELKNGDIIKGLIKERDKNGIVIKTNYGELAIDNGKINEIYYSKNMENYEKIRNLTFYKGEEKVIDVFKKPTGNVMEAGTFYLSGLSYGFGLTDNFQISSNWSQYFSGNLNIRPKYKLIDKLNNKSRHQLSLGGTIHLKYPKEHLQKTEWDGGDPWTTNFDNDFYDEDDFSEMLEPFIAYTYEMKKKKGNHAFTIGATSLTETNLKSDFSKLFLNYWYDISPRVILMGEFKTTYNVESNDFLENEITDYLDFGFVYAHKVSNRDLRVGIHFQEPFFTFYYKIY